ncbi:GIY-YIG nuclease family protein [Campylobacter sp. RM16191]|uniref:GIY-YIG nuclease family protein n=1 Tax=Campylobacter sp. RM16191 TaxID=1705728 RepID=UPI002015FE47|nr:GIY-YIG nuclease family protein [Campylobacter sp. RM16191]
MFLELAHWDKLEQRALYFKLNNIFNLETQSEKNVAIAGIYAIYKDDICLYVGQSKNLASRVATHLKGKYATASEIFIWNIENIGFSDFSERSTAAQNAILNNVEKWLISQLKPIENILADFNFTLPDTQTPELSLDNNASISIKIDEYFLVIFDTNFLMGDKVAVPVDYMTSYGLITEEVCDRLIEEIQDSIGLVSFVSKNVKKDTK